MMRIFDPDQAGYFFGAGFMLLGIGLAIIAFHRMSRKG